MNEGVSDDLINDPFYRVYFTRIRHHNWYAFQMRINTVVYGDPHKAFLKRVYEPVEQEIRVKEIRIDARFLLIKTLLWLRRKVVLPPLGQQVPVPGAGALVLAVDESQELEVFEQCHQLDGVAVEVRVGLVA